MIEEVVPNIFRVTLPLPLAAVTSMNAYVIIDPGRPLVIDPGMAHPMCREALMAALTDLDIDPTHADFFVTHHHLDHYGQVMQLAASDADIYIHPLEAEEIQCITTGRALENMARILDAMGFPEKDAMKIMPEMFGADYCPVAPRRFTLVDDGDGLKRGGYFFRCLVTPGHTRAHTSLFESERRILISGDQISPVIQYTLPQGDPLGDHLASIRRLIALDIDLVLPGHLSPFTDVRKKLDNLVNHHMRRLKGITGYAGSRNAYQVAEAMWRDTANGEDWEALGLMRRYRSTRDCYTHIRHLGAMKVPVPK